MSTRETLTSAARTVPRHGLTFRVLGPVTVGWPGAEPVAARGAQPALVLAYLVLERPRPLLRDDLFELLWPGPLPDHQEGAARHVISRARRALVAAGLPPESLHSTGGVTTLDAGADLQVDVEVAVARVADAERLLSDREWGEAARLAACALEDLRRPFAPGCDGEWASEWRDRIGAFAGRALLASASAALGAGRSADAERLARTAIDRDQFDEQATRLLMAACKQAGNRAEALGAYERLRRRLDDELGVRPSEETEDDYRELLGEAPSSPGGAAVAVARAMGTITAGRFVGRREEVAVLDEQWQRARGGSCHAVVIEGEAGIGKTRLVLEEAERARARGAAVLWGRCDPDVRIAHGPFADVVAQLATDRPEIIDGMGRLATHLAPLVPELVPPPSDATPGSSEQAAGRLYRAVSGALASAARDPLVIVLDDLHWAGADTLALLRHVAVRLAGHPCLLLLTVREQTSDVAGALAELHRTVPTITLRLEGLSVDDVVALLEDSDVELQDNARTVAAAVTARTAGNPLYLTQLVREAEGSGAPFDPAAMPDAVARLLDRRFASLPGDLAAILLLSAVAGPTFDLATIAACAATAPDEVLDLVEELCRRNYFEELGAGRFGFAHELVRDAVLANVSATRRSLVHRRIADALVRADADPALVVHHFAEAGGACVRETVTWSFIAGRYAMDRAAWSTAVEHFATAVDLAPEPRLRCDALIALGQAERALGSASDSRKTLDDALALALARRLPRQVASATLALIGGGGRGVAVEMADAERMRLLRAALEGLDNHDADLLVPVLAELALSLVLTDATDERVALCDRCLDVARASGDAGGLATALWARRIALMGPSGTEARVADGREAVALSRAEVPPESVLAANLGLVEDFLELGDRAGADLALDTATRLAAALDHPYWSWATACWRTLFAIIDGRIDEAEQLASAALELQAPGNHPEAFAAFGVNLVDIRLFQDRAGEMIDLLRAAADDNTHIPCYRAVLALCCADSGDLAAAREALDFFAARGFEIPADSNWLLAVAVLADACASLGDARAASALEVLLEPWADRHVVLNCYGGGGAFWGPVAHHLGRLAAVRGDEARARSLLGQAVELSEGLRAPLFAGRSRAALEALG